LTRFGRWKQRSSKEATHLPDGAGYKWAYTARRGIIAQRMKLQFTSILMNANFRDFV